MPEEEKWYDPFERFSFSSRETEQHSYFEHTSQQMKPNPEYIESTRQYLENRDVAQKLEDTGLASGQVIVVARSGDLYLLLRGDVRVRVISQ